MNTGFDLPLIIFGDGQEFDPIPELPAELNIQRVISEIPAMKILETKEGSKGKTDKNGKLMSGIDPFNIIGWISLCVSFLLGFP